MISIEELIEFMPQFVKLTRWVSNGDGKGGEYAYDTEEIPVEKIVAHNGREFEWGTVSFPSNNATFYTCIDDNGKELLMKVLNKRGVKAWKRFEFETYVLKKLPTHPNILKFIASGKIPTSKGDKLSFLITEKYNGGNLEKKIKAEEKLSLEQTLKYSHQILDAFEHIHNHGVIHRDIKPENFLLNENFIIVGDFGLSKSLITGESNGRYFKSDLTAVGEMVGPILWMSPELIKHRHDKKVIVDTRSDIFQIGLIMWYMLTGENLRGNIDAEDYSTEEWVFYKIVEKMTKQKPEKRYQSVQEIREALIKSFGLLGR